MDRSNYVIAVDYKGFGKDETGIAIISRDGIKIIDFFPMSWLLYILVGIAAVYFIGWVLHFFFQDLFPQVFSIGNYVLIGLFVICLLIWIILHGKRSAKEVDRIQYSLSTGTMNQRLSDRETWVFSWDDMKTIGMECNESDSEYCFGFITHSGSFVRLKLDVYRFSNEWMKGDKILMELMPLIDSFAPGKLRHPFGKEEK